MGAVSTVAQREAFREASRPLAELLFVPAPELNIADTLRPGVLQQAKVLSSSGGFYYRLIRTPSGWHHTDTRCTGWLIRGDCAHIKEKNMTNETALVTTHSFALAVFDDAEDDEIVSALSGQITRSWVYEFPMDGETKRGISAVGVEEASGEMAKHGEAIRVIDLKIEYEDEEEARFLVQAGRYAISADGREALLDVTIRGKRQSKKETRRNGGVVVDKFWYEKGVTKAVRNAKLALLPEYAKTHILAEAVKAGKVRQVQAPVRQGRDQLPAAQQAPMITNEQKARIFALFRDAARVMEADSYKALMAGFAKEYPDVFPPQGAARYQLLTAVQAGNIIAALDSGAKQEEGAGASGVTEDHSVANPTESEPTSPAASPACPKAPDGQHVAVFNEDKALSECGFCGEPLEGPDMEQPPLGIRQGPLV